jgi:hypothetical protein
MRGSFTGKLTVPPLISPSAEQPNEKPINTQINRIKINLTEIKLIKLLIANMFTPPDFFLTAFIMPP